MTKPNDKLRAALHLSGLSQSELARRIGVDQSQVNKWVAGRMLPTYPQLCRTVTILRGVEGLEDCEPESLGFKLGYRITVEPECDEPPF